ncbi:MAG TPA: TPM domain-containing protein [Nevskiaceae bacterium]|nr:TPM domain-containing protein [Nevskiaceae bacterium]
MALLLALFAAPVHAWLPPVPAPPPVGQHVVDTTGTLSQAQLAYLEQAIAAHPARGHERLAVLVIHTPFPELIEEYSLRTMQGWGRDAQRPLVLLVIARDTATAFIEADAGLDRVITDDIGRSIVADHITPPLREHHLYQATRAGVERTLEALEGQPLRAPAWFSLLHWQRSRLFIPSLLLAALAAGALMGCLLGRRGFLLSTVFAAICTWHFSTAGWATVASAFLAFAACMLSGRRADEAEDKEPDHVWTEQRGRP